MGFRGGNLTIPHKVAVVQYLDRLTEAAELAGAVSCVYREGDELVGEDTDGRGFIQSLQSITSPKGKNVVVFGAGGAARAIAVELGLARAAEITVVNRTAQRGQTLVDLLNERMDVPAKFVHLSGDYVAEEGTDIIINATSIGMGDADARVPLDVESLNSDTLVADVIFNPPDTKLIRDAVARNCTTLDGLGMFVNQAAIAFRIWSQVDPDIAVMREALEEYLEI
jgi:shikimate dehydrogenase